MEHEGKVALVTGGGRGIGRETCLLLAREGAKVAVFSRTQSEVEETVELIRKETGREAIAIAGDVRSAEDADRAVRETREKLGPVDILVNNAGVMLLKPFAETTVEEWDRVQDINVRGTYLFTRAALPDMLAKRQGVIVNVSSIWGTKGGPDRSAYITSKYAVIGFTRALGEELKPCNIRVNAVCPGPTATRMTAGLVSGSTPANWMQPEEIADVIAYLCSSKSSAITASIVEAFGCGKPVGIQ